MAEPLSVIEPTTTDPILDEGDHDRMTRAFRGAERALAEIGARPTPSTLELFANLRG